MLELDPIPRDPVVILDVIPARKNASTVLFNLASQVSGELYVPSDFEMNPPVALDCDRSIAGTVVDPLTGEKTIYYRNTRLLLSPKQYKDIFNTPAVSVGYKLATVVFYDRIHVSDIPDPVIMAGRFKTVYDAIDALSLATGLYFEPRDLVNAPLPPANPDGTVRVPLNITPDSFRYYSSAKVFSGSKIAQCDSEPTATPTETARLLADMQAQITRLRALLEKSRVRTFVFESSLVWKIKHDTMTVNFVESIKNQHGEKLSAALRTVDGNEFWVEFTEPEAGTVSVVFDTSL